MNQLEIEQQNPGLALAVAGIDAGLAGELVLLPDGNWAVEYGDAAGMARFGHLQGDNHLKKKNTAGLCSCESILRRFGVEASEAGLVRYALDQNTKGNVCLVDWLPVKRWHFGHVEPLARLLADNGVPAHFETGLTLKDLAVNLEAGRGVMVAVHAAVIGGIPFHPGDCDFGEADHIIVVSAVDRDPDTGEIVGFKINDSSVGHLKYFVGAEKMGRAWLQTGGGMVVTDEAYPQAGV